MKRPKTLSAERDALARRVTELTVSRDALWASRDTLSQEVKRLKIERTTANDALVRARTAPDSIILGPGKRIVICT